MSVVHFVHHLGRPAHHREHPPSAGGPRPVGRLAEADLADPEVTELGGLGVGPEVVALEHHHLPQAAQAPAVGDLEHGGVPERRHPPLAASHPDPVGPGVGGVEQVLALGPGHRPSPGPGLGVDHVGHQIGPPTDLDGVGPEAGEALPVPAVDGVADVGQKAPEAGLVAPEGRGRCPVLHPQALLPTTSRTRRVSTPRGTTTPTPGSDGPPGRRRRWWRTTAPAAAGPANRRASPRTPPTRDPAPRHRRPGSDEPPRPRSCLAQGHPSWSQLTR